MCYIFFESNKGGGLERQRQVGLVLPSGVGVERCRWTGVCVCEQDRYMMEASHCSIESGVSGGVHVVRVRLVSARTAQHGQPPTRILLSQHPRCKEPFNNVNSLMTMCRLRPTAGEERRMRRVCTGDTIRVSRECMCAGADVISTTS